MSTTLRSLALPAILAACLPAQAAISVGSASFIYTQSFDSLAPSGSAVAWTNDSTLAGWSLFNFTGAALASYGADNGSSNAGAFKSYGANGSSERAFGGLGSGGAYFGSPPSGQVAGWMALALRNDSGSTLGAITLAYDGEQWRNGGNTSAQTMALEYGFGSSFASVASWAAAGSTFAYASPVVGSTAAAVDGNGAGKVGGLGGTIATAWAPGQTLWLRWVEVNDSGNDHGLAIDNLAISVLAAPVPENGTAAMLLAGLLGVAFVARRRA